MSDTRQVCASSGDCTHLALRDGYCLTCATLQLRDRVLASKLAHIPPDHHG